jgi:TolB-like protein
MRTLPCYLLSFLFSLQSFLFPVHSFAQDKPDVVIMLTGEKKTGKVMAVNDQSIKFVYSGETLQYDIKKELINKIDFGSGREEIINGTSQSPPIQPLAPISTPEQRVNKIAVLPFEILSNDPSLITSAMSKQVQLSCINALRGIKPQLMIQDPNTTNALLAKSNLTTENLSSKTPQEWAEFLGVEYVIMGDYSIQNKGTVASSSNYQSSSSQKSDDGQKKSSSTYGSGTSSTSTSYNTKVTLNIYKDDGSTFYSNTRSPAFGTLDSYAPALKYMLKRTPFAK